MATQYQVAYSKDVAGAGVIGAGPWLCAQGIVTRALRDCLAGASGGPDEAPLVAALRASAAVQCRGRSVRTRGGPYLDLPRRQGRQGGRGGFGFAAALLQGIRAARAGALRDAGTGGARVSDARDGDACDADASPWILACGYDAAGEMLQASLRRSRGTAGSRVTGTLLRVRPGALRRTRRARARWHDTGFLFVPRECAAGQPCRLHVAFHGCRQGIGFLGRTFARQTGYNRWADTNRIVVLYPQVKASTSWPVNPRGCWDWWGYSGADYAAKRGAQLSAVRLMLEALGLR